MSNNFTIREFNYLYPSKISGKGDNKDSFAIEETEFETIKNFVLQYRSDDSSDPCEFLNIGSNRKHKEILKAKNYVGIIQTKTGTTIEILPKIFLDDDEKEVEKGYPRTKKVFLNMLKALKKSPFKNFDISNVKTEKMHLLDIFIIMFLDELNKLLRKGLKSDYILVEENSKFLKGKLKINDNIKKNIAHAELFYVQYDSYIKNRPENKLIKSTLEHLSNKTSSIKIGRRIKKYLGYFDEIETSKNFSTDFSVCKSNRLMKDYELIIGWCKIFLNNESFTNYKGSNIAYALLFPMEKIYESYIAAQLKKSSYFSIYEIIPQHRQKYLSEEPKKFQLKPDIVLKQNNHAKIIMDTKWKILIDDEDKNYGISQSDMYQMYAYGKKYSVNEIFLLYPKSGNFKNNLEKMFRLDKNMQVQILLMDLENINESLKEMSKKICQ